MTVKEIERKTNEIVVNVMYEYAEADITLKKAKTIKKK